MKKIFLYAICTGILSTSAMVAHANHHERHGDYKHKFFEKMDANGDGVVSKEEFLTQSEKKFSDMDSNRDGNVDKDEAKKFRETMREKIKEKMQERHTQTDTPHEEYPEADHDIK